MRPSPAVFLDRDGTINEEVGYLDRMDKLRLLPGAAEAVRLINRDGMKAVVITNQSGIGRGMFDEAFVMEVHAEMSRRLRKEGAAIDGYYFCPHHPTEGIGGYRQSCPCRKPAPGMLLRAAAELAIDLSRSYMIGDMPKDVEAGQRAGGKGILVRTGYGQNADLGAVTPDHIAPDILAAVRWILARREGDP
ncbi:MAG: HAD family hydrolase [Pseudomonadota bacterium]|nr:HAD family hydrolase [Pseudomonadota bacterium]